MLERVLKIVAAALLSQCDADPARALWRRGLQAKTVARRVRADTRRDLIRMNARLSW
jgi:hypothetical protein